MAALRTYLFILLFLLPLSVWSGERILSLSPSHTAMLFAIGAGEDVVGVTDFCRFPEEAMTRTRTGGFLDPNIEVMLSLRPTVAFHLPSTRGTEQILAQAGVRLFSIPAERLADIDAGMVRMGEILGREESAEPAVSDFRAGLAALQEAAEKEDPVRTLIVMGRPPGAIRSVFAVGPNNFIDDLLTLAGGENALSGSLAPYPEVSVEMLLANPPKVIIETRSGDFLQDPEAQARARLEWEALFARQGQQPTIFFLNDPQLTIPSPGVVESGWRLHRLLHGEAGEE